MKYSVSICEAGHAGVSKLINPAMPDGTTMAVLTSETGEPIGIDATGLEAEAVVELLEGIAADIRGGKL